MSNNADLSSFIVLEKSSRHPKGVGRKSLRKITANQMADAVITVMSDFDGVTPEMQKNSKAALMPYFTKPLKRKMDDKRGTMH